MKLRLDALAAALLPVLAACHTTKVDDAAKDAATTAVAPGDAATHGPFGQGCAGPARSPVTLGVSDASADAAVDAAIGLGALSLGDGGSSACRRVFGPMKMPFDGPAVMNVHGDVLDLVTNDRGHPRVTSLPIPASLTAAPRPPTPTATFEVTHPRCAVANDSTFCVGGGSILARFDGKGGHLDLAHVAGVRGIAAAPLGPNHDVVAWMQSRKTDEGVVSEGFLSIDGKPALHLSEEGGGATALDLVARENEVVAVYIDARIAMTPVHARVVQLDTTSEYGAHLGDDSVIFVGPTSLASTAPVLGRSATHADVLLGWPQEPSGFGMAAIELSSPLKIDLGATWSPYIGGLDPSPVAVTRGDKMHVARIVPLALGLHPPLALELGEVGDHGAFQSYGAIANGNTLSDLAIADDSHSGTWILWSDADSTWLVRRACP